MKLLRFLLLGFVLAVSFGARVALAAYVSSAGASGNSTTPSVAVPSGAASGIIAILAIGFDTSTPTVTLPAGFTNCTNSPLRVTAEGQTVVAAWKRLSGVDSGTYDVTLSGAATDWVIGVAFFSGRHASNDPVCTSSVQNTGQASPVSINAADVTALEGDDMAWVSGPDVSGSGIATGPGLHTVPTNYTERVDTENAWANLCIATRDAVAAGATGVTTGTIALNAGTAGWGAFHIRVPEAEAPAGNLLLRRRRAANDDHIEKPLKVAAGF